MQFLEDEEIAGRTATKQEIKLAAKLARRQAIADAGGEAELEFDNFPIHTAKLTYGALKRLEKHPYVKRISINHPINWSTYTTARAIGADQVWAGSETMPAFTGAGISVAVLDSGTYSGGDMTGKVAYSVFIGGADPTAYGHGTHVAATIVGNGGLSAPGTGFPVQYKGIAYGAKVISVRVLGGDGVGLTSNVIAGLDWCITNKSYYNIRVINLSLGHPVFESYKTDPLCQAVERSCQRRDRRGRRRRQFREKRRWFSGAIRRHYESCQRSGSDHGRRHRHQGHYCAQRRHHCQLQLARPNCHRRFDQARHRRPGQQGDCLSPIRTPGSLFRYPANRVYPPGSTDDSKAYLMMSGTSMATPVVSATVALMLEANPSLTPNAVKAILAYTAQRMTDSQHPRAGERLSECRRRCSSGALHLAELQHTGGGCPVDRQSIGNQKLQHHRR